MYTLFRKSQFKNALPGSLGCRTMLLLLLSMCILLSAMPLEAQAEAEDYTIKWYAADPQENKGSYLPTYLKMSPASISCGDTLDNAVAYAAPPIPANLDAVTALTPAYMMLGQIVPFEIEVTVNGAATPETGITFNATWNTKTTSNGNFGYDPAHMVYCAFVDTTDPGTKDPGQDAAVSYRSSLINTGTNNEAIRGDFTVTGLDDGDRIIVEVWVVLKKTIPAGTTGNVQSALIKNANTVPSTKKISIGTQTIPLQKVDDFVGQYIFDSTYLCNEPFKLKVVSPYPNGMYLDVSILNNTDPFYSAIGIAKDNGAYIIDTSPTKLSTGNYVVSVKEKDAQEKVIGTDTYNFSLACVTPEFPIGSFVVLLLAGVIYVAMRRKMDGFSNGKR